MDLFTDITAGEGIVCHHPKYTDERHLSFASATVPCHTLSVKLRAEWCKHPDCAPVVTVLPDNGAKLAVDNVAMLVGTHSGKRLSVRGRCEVCNTPTNWVITTQGRVGAYWCGCGNA